MPSHHLQTYLNDHLGGATAAVEMLPRLIEKHSDVIDVGVVRQVLADIEEDKRALEALMERLGMDHSRMRQAAGWISERFTRLKLAMDDPGDGTFRAFEMVEIIALGIEGKHSLWTSLATIAGTDPTLGGVALEELMQRALSQRAALEPLRRSLARLALASH